MRYRNLGVVIGAAALLSGCAAAQTALTHKDLAVQTKMSATIFLDPVPVSEHTIFIQTRNTTDKPDFTIDSGLRAALAAKGYQVVTDPTAAHYVLQANILSVGKIDPSAAQTAFLGGYGSTLGAAAAGASIGLLGGQSAGDGLAGGILGGATDLVANALVKNVTYAVITDMQISERSATAVTQTTAAHVRQGTTATREQVSTTTTNHQTFQTRILSTANQVNLDFVDAEPALEKGLITSIAGVF